MGKLDGKTAIVTGAGSGIGRATATLFAKEGAKVCVADISSEGGKESLKFISDIAGVSKDKVIFAKVDISKEEQVKKMVEDTVGKYGQLDILFNNAGIFRPAPVENTSTEDWNDSIAVNLSGSFFGIKYAVPHLIKTRGAIVNIGSVAGLRGFHNEAAYLVSKAGVIGLTEAAALDLAKYGIRVNCVCPGAIDTSMQKEARLKFGTSERMMKVYAAAYPLGRIGTPEEVARLVLFLASSDSSFMTGNAIQIDGGFVTQTVNAMYSKINV